MSWLEKIRSSDNSTKMRYLIIFSGLAGIVVVWFWATAVKGIIESTNTAPTTSDTAVESSSSFFSKIGSAWNGIVDRTKNTVKFFSEKVGETNEIKIENGK